MTILGLDRSGHHPTIITLDIHMEGDRQFVFNPDTTTYSALSESSPSKSKLEAFFQLCGNDLFATTLKYHEVPEYYIWGNGEWKRRRIGGTSIPQQDGSLIIHSNAIGRIYSMSPKSGDIYYLRLLLITIPGPTSYIDLRTVDGETLPTFQEACKRHGLLDNDDHIINGMREIAHTSTAKKLREFFVTALMSCEPSDPSSLWDTYADDLCEDFIIERRRLYNDLTLGIESFFQIYSITSATNCHIKLTLYQHQFIHEFALKMIYTIFI